MHQSNLVPELGCGGFPAQGGNSGGQVSLPDSTTIPTTTLSAYWQQQLMKPPMAKHKRKSSGGGMDGREGSGSASSGHAQQKKVKTGLGSDRPQGGQQGKIDPTFGQRSAIPGLDDDDRYAYEEPGDSDSHDEAMHLGEASGSEGMGEEERVGREALQYLRAVRLEATTLPSLFVAPRPVETLEEDAEYDENDENGYYEDGAYLAAPETTGQDDNKYPWEREEEAAKVEAEKARIPAEAYHISICKRFSALRSGLAETPPRYAVARLSKHQSYQMSGSAGEWRTWRWNLANTIPAPAQLASMSKGTILRLLRLITKELGGGSSGVAKGYISKMMSRWVWALLARLPEVGELNSEEVGIVRDLGKRAVWLGVRLSGKYDMSLVEDEDDVDDPGVGEEALDSVVEDDGDATAEVDPDVAAAGTSMDPTATLAEEELETARARILAGLKSNESAELNMEDDIPAAHANGKGPEEETEDSLLSNTKVTIDTIITITGELFGQRDLLQYREEWT